MWGEIEVNGVCKKERSSLTSGKPRNARKRVKSIEDIIIGPGHGKKEIKKDKSA